MATQHHHRILAIAANARRNAINNAITANIDPQGGNWLTVGLSATGEAPATYWMFSAQLVNSDVAWMLNRWYALASMTPPTWGSLTRAQIRSRLQADRAALVAGSQVRMYHMDNDGTWDDVQTILDALGLVCVS